MARKTQVVTDGLSNDQLIDIMQRRAGQAPEPGTLATKQVIHAGDEDLPAPQVVSNLSSAGYCYIYDTRTGERSTTNRNMLLAQLEKTRDDGSLAFSVEDPRITPVRGIYKCQLHPEGASRAEYDALGLVTCRKANLTSPYQVQMHMRHRHPAEWATIEEMRTRQERDDDRAFQRRLLEKAVTA